MKVFLAGGSGVIGASLLPQLIAAGHEVTGMTRTKEGVERLDAWGVRPVICDVFDATSLDEALRRAQPETVIHELTSLPASIDPRKIERQLAANDRIRIEGTANLIAAARAAGARRFIAQSIAFAYRPEGSIVKNEDDPLWMDAPWPWRRSVHAAAALETQTLSADGLDGVVLRYGSFYGPRTAYSPDGPVAHAVRKRRFPVAGKGTGIFSFIHVDDAAAATVSAVAGGDPGVYNIVDDDPAPLRDWLPAYAAALRAPAPRQVPAILVRFLAGSYGHYLLTAQRGASNARARKRLDWTPRFRSWREGFRSEVG